MPRRRRRTTNRKPQDERRLRVRGIRRGKPDASKLSRAFIALAVARAEAEAQQQATKKMDNRRLALGADSQSHDGGHDDAA